MFIEKLSPRLSAEEQYKILSSGTVDLINKEELFNKLKTKKALRIKAGFDPSKPDIHLGHSLLINKLRQFQELGHKVFFVVGDFTACVGDPSGQNKTRPTLSFQEAQDNAKTYIDQVTKENFETSKNLEKDNVRLFSFFKRLDPKKTECRYNSEWLDQTSLRDFILSVCSKFTVARQLERNDFSLRYKSGKPIGLHEFFYPVLQAYDSVKLEADVELGGTDQLFNLLLGRDLQEQYGQSPQVVLTLPLLEGLDAKISGDNWNQPGTRKMSKSLNNAISFNDPPKEIYGKVMKISDDLLVRWWNLFTEGQTDLKKLFQSRGINPKIKKEELAWLLVCSLYGEDKADKAQKEFAKVFSNKGLPDHIPEHQDLLGKEDKREIGVCQLIKELELSPSSSEARRGILAGAVRKDNKEKITDPNKKITLKKDEEFLLSFGRRKFKTVNLKWEKIHDLKAYLAYRKIKESKSKEQICEELSQDKNFKDKKISLDSIKLKVENYKYLDSKGEKGLEHCSILSRKVFEEYKDKSMPEIEQETKKYEREN